MLTNTQRGGGGRESQVSPGDAAAAFIFIKTHKFHSEFHRGKTWNLQIFSFFLPPPSLLLPAFGAVTKSRASLRLSRTKAFRRHYKDNDQHLGPVCDTSTASARDEGKGRERGGGEVNALQSFERHMMRVLITSARILSTFFAETCAVTSASKREDGASLNKQRWAPAAVSC